MSKYKKNKAVALKYNAAEDASPVVIASGYGTVAEHIIDIAEKKGIPVFKDDSAASLLCMLDVGSNIPVELYEVVAAIYCKLIETSAQIRGVEDGKSARAGNPDGSAVGRNAAGRNAVGGNVAGRNVAGGNAMGRNAPDGSVAARNAVGGNGAGMPGGVSGAENGSSSRIRRNLASRRNRGGQESRENRE